MSFWLTVAFSTINFAIFIFVMKRLVGTRLRKWLETKGNELREALMKSEKVLKEAEEEFLRWQKIFEEAEKEAENEKQRIIKMAELEAKKILEQAKASALEMLKNANELAKAEYWRVQSEVKNFILEKAVALAEVGVAETKTKEDEEKFFEEVISRLG